MDENKANENKALYSKALRWETIKNNKKVVFLYVKLTNLLSFYHLKLDFKKMDQHTGGKWLIHGTKRRRDNQLQTYDSVEYFSRECEHDWCMINLDKCFANKVILHAFNLMS